MISASLRALADARPPAPRGASVLHQQTRAQQLAALLEDVEFMARFGETMPGAARRLELTPDQLYRRLRGAGRLDLAARLPWPERHATSSEVENQEDDPINPLDR